MVDDLQVGLWMLGFRGGIGCACQELVGAENWGCII